MPEFQVPVAKDDLTWAELDSFVQGYLEAMFFTDCNPDEPELADMGFSDLDPLSLEEAIAECGRFTHLAKTLLPQAYDCTDYDEQAAGRDFWYTRNGHGVGFWDRDQLPKELGRSLSALARKFGNIDAYAGDDGRLHLS